MKVILVMVQSIDGKITRWEDQNVYEWTSSEDKKHFRQLIKEVRLMVMGRKTFELARPKPQEGILRVVVTKNPPEFQSEQVPNQLEFTSASLKVIVQNLEKRGYKTMLLVGGAALNTAFLKEGLVDELWLTVEPKIFGSGKKIVGEEKMDVKLKLYDLKKLNDQGALLLKYKVEG